MKPLIKRIFYWFIRTFGATIVDQRTGEPLGKGLVIAFGGTVRLLGYGLQQPYVHAVFLPERRILSFSHRIGFATYPPVDYPGIAKRSVSGYSLDVIGEDAERPVSSYELDVSGNSDTNSNPASSKPSHLSTLPPSDDSPTSSEPSNLFTLTPSCDSQVSSPRVLFVLLAHAKADDLKTLVHYWHRSGVAPEDLLVVYGGPKDEFDRLDVGNSRFVPDADLRTRHHQLEKQSYQGPMREAAAWLQDQPHTHVCFVEQDHIPLVSDWGARMIDRLTREDADVLCNGLRRVDGTDNPHYRYQLSDPKFTTAWQSISCREDKNVILTSIGTGLFWKREAFIHTAETRLPTRIYLEEATPTTAHHLGYRVRDFGEQARFALMHELRTPSELEEAKAAGGWSAHKVKDLELIARYRINP